jgi:predicted nuclease of predicted toxin-antitoxin system
MKIILDENLPRGLKRYLSAYEVTTVQEQGWAGFKNGELMTRIDGVYDVFLTSDKNLKYQQNLTGRTIAIIELPTNRLKLLETITDKILAEVESVSLGMYVQVSL